MLLKDMPDHGRLIIDKQKLNFFKSDDTNKKEMPRKAIESLIEQFIKGYPYAFSGDSGTFAWIEFNNHIQRRQINHKSTQFQDYHQLIYYKNKSFHR